MSIHSQFDPKKNHLYVEEIIQYCLFSSLKRSMKIKNQKNNQQHYFYTILGYWFVNKKNLKNNTAFVFLPTTETLYTFIRFFVVFTKKIKFLNLVSNSRLQLENNFIYVALRNNLKYIKIRSKLLNHLKLKTSSFYSIKNPLKEFFVLTEYTNGKLKYSIVNISHQNKKSATLHFSQKYENLTLSVIINCKKLPFLLNSIQMRLTTSLEFFFKSLDLIIKMPKIKILIISNDISKLASFCIRNINNNFLLLKNTSSIVSTLKALKRFNSYQPQSLVICADNWKKNNLFNRIDPRELTIIFKINLQTITTKKYNIKSFFYF